MVLSLYISHMLPDFNTNFNMSTTEKESYKFIYKGVQYDASEYAEQHPGGLSFLSNMKAVAKDFTEYFRALHSDSAEKILKSFPIVNVGQPSQSSQEYLEIYGKVEIFYQPLWSIQILLCLLVASTWFIGCVTEYSLLSILCFGLTQVLISWIGHSAAHSRNRTLNCFGRFQTSLLGGFSLQWWNPKHNMHHMFTNIQKYDEDIQHQYKAYLFQFLYLKWRFDSLVSAVRSRNYIDIVCILLNYVCLAIWSRNLLNWLIGELISGFYAAIILIGNHQRQKRYHEKPDVPFIDHQLLTCRNYKQDNLIWLLLMGGMQFQTQHHLFPQIPFYRLPAARMIIKGELARLGKSMIYGSVL